MYIDDTIAAIATPPGIGGGGIIRVSGKDSFPIVNSLFKSAGTVPLMDRQNRTIQYGTIVDPATNKTIDEVLVLLMKGPHSYTAEDVVEIQCHGGIVPVRQILKLLVNHDVRMAEAGEFTKRAFMNGRIDLTQAEAIIDIIEAKTEEEWINLSEVGITLSKRVPGFDPRNYKYQKLRQLIESFDAFETKAIPNPHNKLLKIVYVKEKEYS